MVVLVLGYALKFLTSLLKICNSSPRTAQKIMVFLSDLSAITRIGSPAN